MNTKWNKDVEKRILRKSRFTLTFRILRILIAALILFTIYTSFLDAYGNTAKSFKKAHFYNELAIEWTNPNVRSVMAMPTWEVNNWGVGEINYPLFKRVGSGVVKVGEATISKPIWPLMGQKVVSIDGDQAALSSKFEFYYGKHPVTGENVRPSESNEAWENLEMLPEGTVGELAFSLENMMNAKELVDKLESYDLGITWMALYTGEYQEGSSVQDETSQSWGDGNRVITTNPIGLTPFYSMEEDFMGSGITSFIDKYNLQESERVMIENMQKVLREDIRYQQDFLGLMDLQERYDYIEANGFITFGAVVTGPVKELVKLKEDKEIINPQLGEVELWNWSNE